MSTIYESTAAEPEHFEYLRDEEIIEESPSVEIGSRE